MRPALSRATGVGVYLQNLVKALAEIDSENQYHLFSSSWSERYRNGSYGRNFHIHDQHWPGKILHFAWNRFSFPSIESMLGIHVDVAHSPSPLLIPSKGARRVTTVHDLYFYFHPEHTTREIQRDYPELVKKHCQQSDAIIAVSEYTRQQLVEHLQVASSRIYTIRHGSDPFFEERASDEEKKQVATAFALERPFFLFVTGTCAAARMRRRPSRAPWGGVVFPSGFRPPDSSDQGVFHLKTLLPLPSAAVLTYRTIVPEF